jgi:hypothetical protein
MEMQAAKNEQRRKRHDIAEDKGAGLQRAADDKKKENKEAGAEDVEASEGHEATEEQESEIAKKTDAATCVVSGPGLMQEAETEADDSEEADKDDKGEEENKVDNLQPIVKDSIDADLEAILEDDEAFQKYQDEAKEADSQQRTKQEEHPQEEEGAEKENLEQVASDAHEDVRATDAKGKSAEQTKMEDEAEAEKAQCSASKEERPKQEENTMALDGEEKTTKCEETEQDKYYMDMKRARLEKLVHLRQELKAAEERRRRKGEKLSKLAELKTFGCGL